MASSKEIYAVVGKRIKSLRKQLGLTQEELAHYANLDFRSIGAVERGERNLSLKSLNAIAKALKVTPDFFIKEESSKYKEEKKILMQDIHYLLENIDKEKIKFILQFIKDFLSYEKQNK